MTDNNFSLSDETINKLFDNGECLTYFPYENNEAKKLAKKISNEFLKTHPNIKRTQVKSKTAKLPQGKYNPNFHYFSDGTFIHACYQNADLLSRIRKMLQIRGLKINKIYGPKSSYDYMVYSDFLRKISEQALIKYPCKNDLYAEEFPNKDNFVADCFDNGNILLTADKNELLPADCRSFMALFADGKYYVSEDYTDSFGSKNTGKVHKFKYKYMCNYCYCAVQYIPQKYIDALYEKAKEYDWYISADDVEKKLKTNSETDNDMRQYIDDLFANRACVSVTNPDFQTTFMSPDFSRYVVFSDGLVLSSFYDINDKIFMKDLHKYYPNHEFRIEKVSDECISEIYRRLPEFQKGATQIYIEMLKQKARKLKKMLGIAHHEALDIIAQMAEWKNWKSVKIEDEMHARQLISAEKFRKDLATRFNAENPLLQEWQHFQKHQHN